MFKWALSAGEHPAAIRSLKVTVPGSSATSPGSPGRGFVFIWKINENNVFILLGLGAVPLGMSMFFVREERLGGGKASAGGIVRALCTAVQAVLRRLGRWTLFRLERPFEHLHARLFLSAALISRIPSPALLPSWHALLRSALHTPACQSWLTRRCSPVGTITRVRSTRTRCLSCTRWGRGRRCGVTVEGTEG
eukprot:335039-Chlamydomonas_euryale.AAC.3